MKLQAAEKKKKERAEAAGRFYLYMCFTSLLLTLIFTIIPTIRAFLLSLTNATSLGLNSKFVFLENYKYMFRDEYFILALKNTLKLMAVVPIITIAIALVLAFIISQSDLKERGLYRTVFYFPNIISLTVVGIIWSFVFHPTMGILNSFLNGVGLSAWAKSWLGDGSTALWCIAVTLVWQATGYYMVMHIAAMDGISSEIYEAATIDGAGPVRKMFSITLPLIKRHYRYYVCIGSFGNDKFKLYLIQGYDRWRTKRCILRIAPVHVYPGIYKR